MTSNSEVYTLSPTCSTSTSLAGDIYTTGDRQYNLLELKCQAMQLV